MRLWSLHPQYLDPKGLVALWREALLAQAVLQGKTKGYTNHPQLNRFKESKNSIAAINIYLQHVWQEADARKYSFDRKKISPPKIVPKIKINSGQIEYEWLHLQNKLEKRVDNHKKEIKKYSEIKLHPLFDLKEGPIENWEIKKHTS